MLRRRVPEWLAAAPDMPQLVHSYLDQATRGALELRIASDDLRRLESRLARGQRIVAWLALGLCFALAAALFALAVAA